MTQFQPDERSKFRRTQSERAIQLAMQSKWSEAVDVNRAILEVFPSDVDALNRLGKAFTEVGKYSEARDAYSRAIGIDPNNTIARKNLTRLQQIKRADLPEKERTDRVDPKLFIEETGKTGFTTLVRLAPRDVIAKLSAGDQVYLRQDGTMVRVDNSRGEHVGDIEARLALRLLNLMKTGNQYATAVTNLDDNQVRIIIKETFQDPQNVGRVSFPTKATDAFRGYTRESLLRYESDEDDGDDLEEWGSEWEGEAEHEAAEGEYYEDDSGSEEKSDDYDGWGKG